MRTAQVNRARRSCLRHAALNAQGHAGLWLEVYWGRKPHHHRQPNPIDGVSGPVRLTFDAAMVWGPASRLTYGGPCYRTSSQCPSGFNFFSASNFVSYSCRTIPPAFMNFFILPLFACCIFFRPASGSDRARGDQSSGYHHGSAPANFGGVRHVQGAH
jgi:hypothetical protein